ncbi:MAG: bifunctional folylpolyglutamate synthase/dihydrofolate synthase, partial [Planctomycetaceae bacterium]
LEERFVVDGELPDPEQVAGLIEAVRVEADRLAAAGFGEPTFFELTTAVALLHFRCCDCDAVVLEVGLGGKLDSTNVCHPAVTAITSIGLDHQHILGHTLHDIATQKAGIIKPGVPIVSGVTQSEACRAIAKIATAKRAHLFAIGKQFECRVREPDDAEDWQTSFDLISHDPLLQDRQGWTLPLEGAHQAANAAVACAVIDLLAKQAMKVSAADQQRSLAEIRLAGRVERFAVQPDVDVVLDTAHNVDSIDALCRCIARRKAGRPVTIVFGTSRDKAHAAMLALLSEQADCMILTRYHGNPRYRDPAELRQELAADKPALVIEDPASAVRTAIQQRTGRHLIVVCGSFFLAAEVRPLLRKLAGR